MGRPIVYKFANSRLGHMCLIDAEKVETAEKYFGSAGLYPGKCAAGAPGAALLRHCGGGMRHRCGVCAANASVWRDHGLLVPCCQRAGKCAGGL